MEAKLCRMIMKAGGADCAGTGDWPWGQWWVVRTSLLLPGVLVSRAATGEGGI